MGQSPSAYLYCGIKIPGSEEYLQEGDEGFEAQEWLSKYLEGENEEERVEFDLGDFLAAKSGLVSPWNEVGDLSSEEYVAFKETNPDFQKRTSAYRSAKAVLEENAPIQVGTYGSYEFGGLILYLPGAKASATCWKEEVVDMEAVFTAVTPEAVAKAREFCENHGMPPFENPQWWLCPSYG